MGSMRPCGSAEEGAVKHQFYGRRKSRPLRAVRQDALETVLPQTEIRDLTKALNFPFKPEALWLEIGFGNGDSLAAWHREHPRIGFIGCEPFINGVAHLCKLVADDDLSNLRIWRDIAQPLLAAIPDGVFERIYILNSDPWPKKKHHRRRVIQQDTLDALWRVMRAGGSLIVTTDHQSLAEWTIEQTLRHGKFEWTAKSQADWQTPPEGWLPTRYEGKGATAGRQQSYLIFRKPV
ncbi:MAG: tRNA (guanine(46)-N(7))-methyltransferase TrmB [Alphaproteobacteria bacterium]|nr:tRNA (guanine(46)-N(7))-methyltransferase TrmB [Alphaproteobacteria bacterium]